jgi:PadR family transcriptional regulator, regulatory protein PadR
VVIAKYHITPHSLREGVPNERNAAESYQSNTARSIRYPLLLIIDIFGACSFQSFSARALGALGVWRLLKACHTAPGSSERQIPLAYRVERAYSDIGYRGEWMSRPSDLVQGTLDLLLLKILALQPMNGYAISQRLRQVSGSVLQVSDGSLYPALHKLEQEGWIRAEWRLSENNRRAKFYSLTRLGRKQLEKESESWDRLSAAITQVVKLEEV